MKKLVPVVRCKALEKSWRMSLARHVAKYREADQVADQEADQEADREAGRQEA